MRINLYIYHFINYNDNFDKRLGYYIKELEKEMSMVQKLKDWVAAIITGMVFGSIIVLLGIVGIVIGLGIVELAVLINR